MTDEIRTSTELRNMLGANLKQLARQYPSVSELCRQLGINRTQFNRYLSGESFPRPDVLDRICRFFNVDARILLKPLDEIERCNHDDLPVALSQFLKPGLVSLTEDMFPNGVYHVAECEQDHHSPTRHWLFLARRVNQCAVLRGFLPRAGSSDPTVQGREVQGFAACTGPNIYALMSRRQWSDCRMLVFQKKQAPAGPLWTGHSSELSSQSRRTHDLEIRYLGNDFTESLKVARLMNR